MPNIKVRLQQQDGRLTAQSPVSVKGLKPGIQSIEDIGDVDELSVVDGATVVYNANDELYEIKKLLFNQLDGSIDLDFGTF